MKKIKPNRDLDRVLDIIKQVDFILTHTNIDEDEFYSNEVLKLAILKSLEIIGEAANQISTELKLTYKELDWKEMVRARNYYVHEYFAVEWPWVWQSIKNEIDFDKIKNYCLEILENEKRIYKICNH